MDEHPQICAAKPLLDLGLILPNSTFFRTAIAAVLLFWGGIFAFAQSPTSLTINVLDKKSGPENPYFQQKVFTENKCRPNADGLMECPVRDSIDGAILLKKIVENLRADGWLLASADSFFWKKNDRRAALFLGEKFRWAEIRADSATQFWLRDARLDGLEKKTRRSPADIFLFEKKLVQHLENQGFAFASVQLDSLEIGEIGGLRARLNLVAGPIFFYEDPKVSGDAGISKHYLTNLLGIRPGTPYRFSQIEKMPLRLRSSPFLEMAASPTVTFTGDRARVNFFLKKKRASRFDFLIGLLPRTGAAGGSGVLLTGQATAEFLNPFGQGERIFADFQRLRPETQRLDIEAGWPWVLGSPFGAEGRLHLYRRDSTFLEFSADGGLQYLFEGGDYLKVFWENSSSNLLKINELQIKSTRRLPENLDARANTFGLETNLNRLDYRFNPRRGWSAKIRAGAGFRQVLRNSDILKLDDGLANFSAQYDSLTGKNPTARTSGKLEFFQPFFKNTTLKIGLAGGGIFSKKAIVMNEQSRIGGQRTLRGYDEESVFATRWLVGTLEWRLLIGSNSYFAAFGDYGYVENLTNRTAQFLHPLGLGVGMSFETKAGIFGLSMAVGRPEGGAVDFRAAKFHLGYLSLF